MSDDYLVKNATMEQLAEAIRNVTGIESLLTPEQMIEVISVMQKISADDKSIEIEDDSLQIKDFEKKYYKIENNEETEVTGFARDLRPVTVPDEEEEGYKLAWIKDKRVQEIDYENLDNAENEYPSVKAIIRDKLLSINTEDITPEDLPKNVTLSALLGYDSKNHVSNPNLWELSAGWYLSRGVINIAPETPLDRLATDRVILISNVVVAAPLCAYVAIIMPTEISGIGSGASMVYCFYDRTSTDPEDFSYQTENILTSGIIETDISETNNRVPSSLAVVNYVADKLSVTEVANPNLWELKTGWYRASGTINVSPNESLSADSDRLILISNQQFADQVYVYSALIMPVNPPASGFGRGMTQVACFYVKDSEDPEDFSHDYRSVLTSDIVEQTIVPSAASEYKIPSELAVVNYVDTLISAINGGSY